MMSPSSPPSGVFGPNNWIVSPAEVGCFVHADKQSPRTAEQEPLFARRTHYRRSLEIDKPSVTDRTQEGKQLYWKTISFDSPKPVKRPEESSEKKFRECGFQCFWHHVATWWNQLFEPATSTSTSTAAQQRRDEVDLLNTGF